MNCLISVSHLRKSFDGVDVTGPKADLSAVRRKMGRVFRNFNLFGNLNVVENLLAEMKSDV